MIDSIRDYLLKYDYFEKNESFINVNFLDYEIGSFSLDPVPTQPVVKKYVDGSAIKQYEFALTSKESYSEDCLKNIEISNFYLDFEKWIYNNNLNNYLPELSFGQESMGIEITTNGILVNNESGDCIYQISLKLKYYEGVN